MRSRPRHRARRILLGALVSTTVLLAHGSPALAADAPGWELTARSFPTYFAPGGRGTIDVNVFNVGAGAAGCTDAQHKEETSENVKHPLCPLNAPQKNPITITDTLPPGVTAREAGELGNYENGLSPNINRELWQCSGNGPGGNVDGATVVTCTNKEVNGPEGEHLSVIPGGGGTPHSRGPNLQPRLGIAVNVGGEQSGLINHVTIAGGGAPTAASTSDEITISSDKPPFGFVGVDGWFSNTDGTLDTQAGSHPYEFTFTFDLANALNQAETQLFPAGGEARDIKVELPPGIVGDPTAVPQCSRQRLEQEECPAASLVGTTTAYFSGSAVQVKGFQVFNMVPPAGVAAEFAFNYAGILTFLDSTVRTGSDYGIATNVRRVPEKEVIGSVLTLWGFPGEASHNPWRIGEQGGCSHEEIEGLRGGGLEDYCLAPKQPLLKPLLTVPTACVGPLQASIGANTWQDASVTSEASFQLHDSNGTPTGFSGCENLGFGPLITTSPDTSDADTPAGLTVDVQPPIGGLQERGLLGTSDIQNTTVTLPDGFVINPGQAAGLQACQPSQSAVGTEDAPSCPLASKVGTVRIKTPLLEGSSEKELEGSVFVLQSNPPELKLLLAASADGINLKLVGTVHLCESTGQLVEGRICQGPGQLITTFLGTPQLPFTDFKLTFSGGAQAALDTPTQCGTYETTADFTPWSSPFLQNFLTNASFSITAGPGGGPCPSNPMPFAPSMVAGSTTDQAGAFTNFSLLLQRGDAQQRIERLQFKEPAGLAGLISSVPLCDEATANAGTCPAASHIGHAVVASGPGPYPLVLPEPGAPELPIYLTGPYKDAPFGLSIVTPVIAGPFNLGTIVTRAKIDVDPTTAQITITTDPLPQIVKGVPTDLRSINAIIDHPGFLFNPTNCNPQEFTGTAMSAGGDATAPLATHFGVGSCQSLKFKPRFSASASGRNSKAGGASLDVKVAYPPEPQGSEANIAKVKVELPKQLPSRLTTLQKACTAAQFDANPAGCPAASVVGHAIVHTSVLPVPLEGPAYFVSNGGEAFPNLIMVLQGYGVTVDLVGDTFINKAGITSSTFKTVPDVPFNTFELMLPQGPASALATNVPAKAGYSLCGQKLSMPTELIAQNGAVINQSTPVGITGCAKTKALTRAQKLARALKACHKKPKGHKRTSCERAARKRFGAVRAKKKSKR